MSEKTFGLAVRAVIFDAQGRCLLIRRSGASKHFAGCWEWPGGKVDAGEDFIAALHRELAEETGLAMRITGLAGATAFEMSALHVVMLCMEAEVTGGTFRLSDEHDAAEWVPLAEFPDWSLPGQVRPFMLDYASRRAAR